MIDYKKYKQVLTEIHKWGSSEDIATAICELFDEKTTWAYKNINTPMNLWESQEKLTPPYIVTCCKG